MAASDVNWVLDFLRRNGFVEAESALRDDLLLRQGSWPVLLGFGFLPDLPPVRIAPPGCRNLDDPNDLESGRSYDSGLFMSAGTPDCFHFHFSSEVKNTNDLSPASLAKSKASYGGVSEFVTAYDYSGSSNSCCDDLFELSDFYWSDFDDRYAEAGTEQNFQVACTIEKGIIGCPSEDKFMLAPEVNEGVTTCREGKEAGHNDLTVTDFAPWKFDNLHPSVDEQQNVFYDHESKSQITTLSCNLRSDQQWDFWDRSSSQLQDAQTSTYKLESCTCHLSCCKFCGNIMRLDREESGLLFINSMGREQDEVSNFSTSGKYIGSFDKLEGVGATNPFAGTQAYEKQELLDQLCYDKKQAIDHRQLLAIPSIEKLNKITSFSTVKSSSRGSDSVVDETKNVSFKLLSARSLEEGIDAKDNNLESSFDVRIIKKPFPEEQYGDAESAACSNFVKECNDPGISAEEDGQKISSGTQMHEHVEDEYEMFELRVIHRRNRTGFEVNKDIPIILNTVIAGRYYVTEHLGSGAFSHVIQAHDLQTGLNVCMKIIKNNKDYFDQSLDEVKLLKLVNKYDPADRCHIVRLYDYFYHQEHLFIVFELLKTNLYELQKFNQDAGADIYFTLPRLQAITQQCLEALDFLHGLGIIHCDLKPENILVKSYSRCEVKVIDLGSSCFQTDNLCLYVQSRSYRAPEVILGLPYNEKIDIWSLGCVLVELFTGHVLFPNDSLAVLLAHMTGILGPIDMKMLEMGQETYKYFTDNYELYDISQETNQMELIHPVESSLEYLLAGADGKFIEFVQNLLHINPERRPNAREALDHPWMSYPY